MEQNFTIIIDSLMKASVFILSAALGYFIAKDKYVFQKTYDRKAVLLTELYVQIVQLEFKLKKYINDGNAGVTKNMTDENTNILDKIKIDFQKFQHKFWETEIILEEDLNKKIQDFLFKYCEITSKLSMSNTQQQRNSHGKAFNSWEDSFKLFDTDLVDIKNHLKKEFRKNLNKL